MTAKEAGAASGNCLWGIHVGRVVWRLAGRVGCGWASSQSLVIGWWSRGLGQVGRWVLCRVGCCWHSWLGGHGVVALVRWSRVAGGHTWRLRVRGVNHGSSCGVGHDRSWATAHLIQTAAGAGKTYDDGGNEHHEDRQANRDSCSKPWHGVTVKTGSKCLRLQKLCVGGKSGLRLCTQLPGPLDSLQHVGAAILVGTGTTAEIRTGPWDQAVFIKRPTYLTVGTGRRRQQQQQQQQGPRRGHRRSHGGTDRRRRDQTDQSQGSGAAATSAPRRGPSLLAPPRPVPGTPA